MSNNGGKCPLGLSRETLSAWRDRELPAAETRRITQHVAACSTCQARVAQFARIAAAVQRQPAPDLRARTWRGIQARLSRQQRHPVPMRRAFAFSGIGATALVAAIVVLFVIAFSQRPGAGTGGTGPTIPGASATPTAPACPTFPAGYHTRIPNPGYTSTNVFANIPVPPFSRLVPNNASGGLRGYNVCGAGTVASITSYMTDHLTALGWTSTGGGVWTKSGYSLTLRISSATDWSISWRDPDLHFSRIVSRASSLAHCVAHESQVMIPGPAEMFGGNVGASDRGTDALPSVRWLLMAPRWPPAMT